MTMCAGKESLHCAIQMHCSLCPLPSRLGHLSNGVQLTGASFSQQRQSCANDLQHSCCLVSRLCTTSLALGAALAGLSRVGHAFTRSWCLQALPSQACIQGIQHGPEDAHRQPGILQDVRHRPHAVGAAPGQSAPGLSAPPRV